MPTMTTEYGPDTITGTTPFTAGAGGGGMNLGGIGGLLNSIAARKAAKEEADRRAAEEARAFEMKMREQEMAMRERELRGAANMRASAAGPASGGARQIDAPQGPSTQLVMDPRTGQWSNWVDPVEAERFNTGRALPGRSALMPGRKDDWNISSGQHAPMDFANKQRRAPQDMADFENMRSKG